MEEEKQEAPLSQTEGAAEVAEQQTQEAPQTPPAVETEARKMGWRPKDEWNGDPEQWKDADTFVKRGKEFEPFVSARLKKENAALQDKLNKQGAEFERRAKNLERMTTVALQQQREAIEERYAERKATAVETGDTEGYKRAVEGEKNALKALDEKAKPDKADDKPPALSASDREAFEDWQDENTWFKADTEMTAFADRKFERLRKSEPETPFTDLLEKVRDAVADKWPDKFRKGGRTNGNGSSRVEGGERTPSDGRGAKGKWAQLPPEAKAQADSLIKSDRLFLKKGETVDKNLNDARERYAASYLEQA